MNEKYYNTKPMEYKGYVGSIEADIEANTLYGTVYGINDVIHYEGTTPQELEQAFHDSVDDYLEMCKESGDTPEKPYSGKFQTRLGEELHRFAASVAAAECISLNEFVCRAIAREAGYTVKGQDSSTRETTGKRVTSAR